MKTGYKMAVILLVFFSVFLSGCIPYSPHGYGYGYGYGYGRGSVYKDPYTHIGNYANHPAGPRAGAYERRMDTQYGPCWRVGRRGIPGRDC